MTDYKIDMLLIVDIDMEGNMKEISVDHGVDKNSMRAAIKALRYTIKKWNPATLRGKPINGKIIVPIDFESRLF